MANVSQLLKKARKRSKEDRAESQTRFKEILAIVKNYDLKEGLTPETTVSLIEDLGTTFVKLGQIASTHPDVLPPEYCEALGSLRTNARPLDFADVKAQVESELGKPIDELFTSFDETPWGLPPSRKCTRPRCRLARSWPSRCSARASSTRSPTTWPSWSASSRCWTW